jgi:hypothetical protein
MRSVWNRLFNLTGFRGKTLWDWMSLLIVPLVIVAATAVLSYFESERENRRADALRKAETERADALAEAESRRLQAQQRIEDDRVQESVLQSYIQDMTGLLLDKGLATSKLDDPVRQIARSRTLTAVRQLGGDRKGVLLQFLYESNLIRKIDPIVRLNGANLRDIDLRRDLIQDESFTIVGAELGGVDLSGVNLGFAHLEYVNLPVLI